MPSHFLRGKSEGTATTSSSSRPCPAPALYLMPFQAFGTRRIDGDKGQKSLLVAIPSFSRTRTAVEVDVRTLTATPIFFGTEAFHQD
eukprot:269202-Hanusia_phi.AAC.1